VANRVVFVYDDAALASKGAVISGTPSADPAFPASNVLNPDRKIRWRTAANPGGQVDLDVDLGGAGVTLSGVAVLGLLTEQVAPAGPDIEFFSSSTGFGALTSRATLTGATYWSELDPGGLRVRDWIETFSAAAGQRYCRWRFAPSSVRFSLGKVLVGTATDFGFYYSPGSEYSWFTPGEITRDADSDLVHLECGLPRRLYDYQYSEIQDSHRLVIEKLARQNRPFAMIDSVGNSNQVVIVPPTPTTFVHLFDETPSLWNGSLRLEQLP